MKKTILVLLSIVLCTGLFSLEESYVREKIKGYYTEKSWKTPGALRITLPTTGCSFPKK